ncbi:MAG: Ig-like domain-containing protein, partial [Roseburia sp.]|nr:Ig-like domain-containing protein [Roseburia sp.]
MTKILGGYTSGDVSITVNKKDIAESEIPVPTFETVTIDEKTESKSAGDLLKNQLTEFNKSCEEWGTWAVSNDFKDELAAATKTVDLTFTANDNYTIDKEESFDKTVAVSVVQMATGVTIKAENEDALVIGTNSKKNKKTLTAEVTPDDVSNAEVEWKSSDESKVKVTPAKGNTAVITALGATDEEGVIITATAKDGSGKSAEYKAVVEEGVSASDFEFPGELDNLTYEGDGTLSDYYEDMLKTINSSTDKGVYSFKDDADVTAGEEKTAT